MIGAEKAVVLSASKVKELTASLNEMLGLPAGTRLVGDFLQRYVLHQWFGRDELLMGASASMG